jgi:hypothetical protein
VSFTQSLVEAFYQTENKHGNMSHNNNKNKIKTTQYNTKNHFNVKIQVKERRQNIRTIEINYLWRSRRK